MTRSFLRSCWHLYRLKKIELFESLRHATDTVSDSSSLLVFSDLSLPEGRDEVVLDHLASHFVEAKVVIVSGHDARFLSGIVSKYPQFESCSKSDLNSDVLARFLDVSHDTK